MKTFEVTSGAIRATDPCYNMDAWCAHTIENVKNGKWRYAVVYVKDDWGGDRDRVAMFAVWHEDHSGQTIPEVLHDGEFGVDSGQFGFFDNAQYSSMSFVDRDNQDENNAFRNGGFYDTIAYGPPSDHYVDSRNAVEGTLSKEGIGRVDFGVASSSGYGDGSYNVYTVPLEDGTIVGLRVVFISDEEEDEYEGECDD